MIVVNSLHQVGATSLVKNKNSIAKTTHFDLSKYNNIKFNEYFNIKVAYLARYDNLIHGESSKNTELSKSDTSRLPVFTKINEKQLMNSLSYQKKLINKPEINPIVKSIMQIENAIENLINKWNDLKEKRINLMQNLIKLKNEIFELQYKLKELDILYKNLVSYDTDSKFDDMASQQNASSSNYNYNGFLNDEYAICKKLCANKLAELSKGKKEFLKYEQLQNYIETKSQQLLNKRDNLINDTPILKEELIRAKLI